MKKRQFIIIGSAATIIIVSFLLMEFLAAQKKDIPRQVPANGERWVKAKKIKYETIDTKVVAQGRVVSTAEVEVVAEASGKIEPGSVPLKKGQNFSKGDTLLIIYKDEMELALKASKSQFLNRIANLLPDIKIDFPDQYDTFTKFFNSIDLDEDFPPLPTIESEKMKIFLSSRNVLDNYFSIKKAEKQLQRHTIIAPFQGTYTKVNLQVGAYTNMGGRIASIIRTDALEVETPVENGQSKFIRIGDAARLFSGSRHISWTGKVVRISDFVDITTQSRSVFVNVPLGGQAKLFAGEYLTVELAGGPIERAIQVPRNAVFNFNEVFVIVDGKLKKEHVDVLKVNEETVIIRGPEEGLFIVTQPLINVAENTDVKILGVDKPSAAPEGKPGKTVAAH